MIDTIVLLAAGDGTRFWPLTEKNLYTFLGKPLLEHQLTSVASLAKKIIVVCNSKNKMLIEPIVAKVPNTSITIQDEEGQGGAVLAAVSTLTGNVLVMNANDIFDVSAIGGLIGDADVSFLAKKVDTYFPGGYVAHENGKVKQIVEKPDPDKVPSDMVKLVADYYKDASELKKALLASKSETDDWYERAINHLISSSNVQAVSYEGFWTSIKYSWNILTAMPYFLNTATRQHGSTAIIHETAIIEGEVQFGPEVRIGAYAKIVGPCFIDEGTIIGDYAMVRESNIASDLYPWGGRAVDADL